MWAAIAVHREAGPALYEAGRQSKLADAGMANWEKADEAVIDNVLPMAKQRARKYKAA